MRPGYIASRVPNCSAMVSGAWLGSMTPPAPSRIVLGLRADVGDQHAGRRRGDRRHVVVLGVPDPLGSRAPPRAGRARRWRRCCCSRSRRGRSAPGRGWTAGCAWGCPSSRLPVQPRPSASRGASRFRSSARRAQFTCLPTRCGCTNSARQRARGPTPHGGRLEEPNVKQTYRVVAGLIALGVLVQAAAVAFGWFDAINEVDNGLVIDENYEGNAGHIVHGIVGMYRHAGARADPADRVLLRREDRARCAQVGRDRLRPDRAPGGAGLRRVRAAPVVGALHGVNALVILGAAGRAVDADPRPAPRLTGERPGQSASRARAPARAAGVVAPCLSRLRPPPVAGASSRWSSSSSLLGELGWYWWRASCPRRTRSWTWAAPTTAAGPPAHDHATGAQVAELTGPADGEPDVAVDLAARRGVTFDLAERRGGRGLHAQRHARPARDRGAAGRPRRRSRCTNVDVPDGVTLHWHGVDVPNAEDGVAGVTQDAVRPGERARLPVRRRGRRHVLVPLPPGVARPGARRAVRHARRPPARTRRTEQDVVAAVHTYGGRRTDRRAAPG